MAVDGADSLDPGGVADALVEPIRAWGDRTVRVRAIDHLRPASLRFERGRGDPDSFYDDWLDEEGYVARYSTRSGPAARAGSVRSGGTPSRIGPGGRASSTCRPAPPSS